jgi:hypothetical protein
MNASYKKAASAAFLLPLHQYSAKLASGWLMPMQAWL